MSRGEGYGESCEDEELTTVEDEPVEVEHIHDVEMLFSGDSPHPVRIECQSCQWSGAVHDAV